MNTKNYNMATHYFREMEKENPNIPQWGAFADAMDEVISTYVPVVRCRNCRWWHESEIKKGYGDCGQANGITVKEENWFCADGERKSD